MKILKKNQVIISVLALMLITVGYMNYTSNITNTLETGALMNSETMAGIGDAKLVNSNNVDDNDGISTEEQNEDGLNENESKEQLNSNGELQSEIGTGVSTSENNSTTNELNRNYQQTSANTYGSAEYFASSKLEREKMYSQMLETYQKLLESQTVSAEQKTISTQEITSINNTKNSIMIAENLIKNLGFENVVIFVNDNSTSVIIKAEKLEEADVAQIQNIVCREIGVETEKIHISLK